MFAKMKQRLGISTTFDLIVILVIFSIAGSTDSLTIRPFVHSLFKFLPKLPAWVHVIVYILVAVPLYQCFLLIYGFLLGQFNFFWQREKKFGRFLKRILRKVFENIANLVRRRESEYV